MSFDQLALCPQILQALSEKGYTSPTPIQQKAIPVVLSGKDVLAGAQTGTGKTAGFTLPLLHLLQQKPVSKLPNGRRPVRALILTPTRELAAQVHESVRTYAKHLPLRSQVVFGGVSINPQMSHLRGGVDILVATPGRLLDLIQQNAIAINTVEIFVLDEADRMLDMGFIHDIKKVMALLPKQRQNLLFSDEIKTLADKLLNSPVLIEVARRNTTSVLVEQRVHPVDRNRKRELLAHLIKQGDWQQVLVFTRTKHGANKLTEQLIQDGITAAAIHGNKSQGARTKALADFKKGSIRALVATDVAARGIDIDKLPHVVNFELPNVPEDYVHRIGRTGRAEAEGEAISLVCVDENEFLRDIERLIKSPIQKTVVVGFEPDPNARPEPIKLGHRTTLSVRGKSTPGGNGGRSRQGANSGGGRSNSGSKPSGGGKPSSAGKPQSAKTSSPRSANSTEKKPSKSFSARPGLTRSHPKTSVR
jgi:ATP-dependent RNA helicase RhlE